MNINHVVIMAGGIGSPGFQYAAAFKRRYQLYQEVEYKALSPYYRDQPADFRPH